MPSSTSLVIRFAPAIFVFLWSTGWIVAKYASAVADPLTFLVVRHASAIALLVPFALIVRAPWPRTRQDIGHSLIAGMLIHGAYLGGVWWAIGQGLPAGISGLIAALQPLLTALLAAPLLGEEIRWQQWCGIAAGSVGISLVLTPKLTGIDIHSLAEAAVPIAVNLLSSVSITFGTFYQKRFVATGDLRTGTCIQYLGALMVTLPLAVTLESLRFEINAVSLAALAWSVIVLSIISIALLLIMIRRGEVSRTAALIYLIPPAVAIEAYVLFGETLSLVQLAGMGLTALGVWLATHKK